MNKGSRKKRKIRPGLWNRYRSLFELRLKKNPRAILGWREKFMLKTRDNWQADRQTNWLLITLGTHRVECLFKNIVFVFKVYSYSMREIGKLLICLSTFSKVSMSKVKGKPQVLENTGNWLKLNMPQFKKSWLIRKCIKNHSYYFTDALYVYSS